MKIQKVTLIGLGAMGVFFAPQLEDFLGKENFRVLADGERKQRLEDKGVTVNGINHKFHIITPDTTGDEADLIIMAVKDTGLSKAIEDIKNQVGKHTQILCVMNGIDSENQLAAVYGWEHVLYSYMRISISMKEGKADFNPQLGKVHFGEADNTELTDRVKAVKELFEASGIKYQIDTDMRKGLWFKFMCNIGENMTCALLEVPFGAFRESEHANAIRHKAMEEVIAIANRLGIDLGEEDIKRQDARIQQIPFGNKPSTLQDLENGRLTEIEMFAGKVVEMGKELGIDTPYNWMFYHAIKVKEEKLSGRFLP
ncbi:2-dehydropantoate 2-reductase [Anaerocolumna cellulosilytica]|uniref:2-dehydropantoate 2-reductase n=1 Tax=Anaerocolumna cellulosilytica TaxID=433286 RepID=A0A6S6QRN8_9FIRM|nr:ketopantoate reductase family protein [Anaerocolumna cellulosilytica]MBB5197204.1 2-dehydropantoate 2-reductase [Anaerocolumna cellulosilytica]BCJ94013.1 2-dehydropantoate 2-reductase [Anaerocolumna cellulosilytica]